MSAMGQTRRLEVCPGPDAPKGCRGWSDVRCRTVTAPGFEALRHREFGSKTPAVLQFLKRA